MFSYPLFRDTIPFSIYARNDNNKTSSNRYQGIPIPSVFQFSLRKMCIPLNNSTCNGPKLIQNGPLSNAIDLQIENERVKNRFISSTISLLLSNSECFADNNKIPIDDNLAPETNSNTNNPNSKNGLKGNNPNLDLDENRIYYKNNCRGFIPLSSLMIILLVIVTILYCMAVEQAKLFMDIPPV